MSNVTGTKMMLASLLTMTNIKVEDYLPAPRKEKKQTDDEREHMLAKAEARRVRRAKKREAEIERMKGG